MLVLILPSAAIIKSKIDGTKNKNELVASKCALPP
jgi:hypothetical protein